MQTTTNNIAEMTETQLRDYLLLKYDLPNYTKADKAFDLAWSNAHSSGNNAVADFFDDLADLLA